MVIFSAFCAIHFRRVFTQVANHLVYDCLCFFGICFDNQVQLICGCVFQVFFLSFQFLYVFFDLVIFCVFDLCHEFLLLICIHAVISIKQRFDNAFLALCDKRFVIRQLIQVFTENSKNCFMRFACSVLNFLYFFDGFLLRLMAFVCSACAASQNLRRILVCLVNLRLFFFREVFRLRFSVFIFLGAVIVQVKALAGVIYLIQFFLQFCADFARIACVRNRKLHVRCCNRSRIEETRIFIVFSCIISGYKIFTRLIQFYAHFTVRIRGFLGKNRCLRIASIVIHRAVYCKGCAFICAV